MRPLIVLSLLAACTQENTVTESPVMLSDMTEFAELTHGSNAAELLDEDQLIGLVFSPADCSVALEAIDQLNTLHRESSTPVVGIINTPYRQAAMKVIEAYEIKFPVLYDSLGVIRSHMRSPLRPALIRTSHGTIDRIAVIGEGDVEAYMEIMEGASLQ